MSMLKTIWPSAIPGEVGACSRVIEDPALFVKAAAGAKVAFDYSKLAPDDDHVGVHSVALGDSETYLFNRNGDGFSKAACRKYHPTFVKHGHVFAHHDHDKAEKAIGKIAASTYNEPMGRIELFLHVNKKKAEPFIEQWIKDGEVPGSMSCRVPGDRCTICSTFRKSARDENQCDHVRYSLGKMMDDGRVVGTWNDDPTFFDYSFVTRPADRIAWSLNKSGAAPADLSKVASWELAEASGLYVPEEVALDSGSATAKYELARKLAGYEKMYARMAVTGPATREEAVLWELRKSASGQALSDDAIERLRLLDPSDVFSALARERIVMDPVSYVKYAFGVGMGPAAGHADSIRAACAGACSRMIDSGEMYDACNDGLYDVDPRVLPSYAAVKIAAECRESGSLDGDSASRRAVLATVEGHRPAMGLVKNSDDFSCSPLAKCVARKYIAYKMAAADAMRAMDKNITEQHYALMAARNMVTTN